MNINIIVAYCKNNGIGLNNQLPWHYPSELKRFAKITKGNGNNAVIMGRKTFESIGKILPNRFNIVLSLSKKFNDCQTCESLEKALELCNEKKFDQIFIIGGQSVYEEALHKKLVHKIYATEINKDFDCDTFFPKISEQFIIHQENKVIENVNVIFKTYEIGCKYPIYKDNFILPSTT